MTSPWTYALLAMTVVALAFSVRVPRAWRWIGLGGLSFFASTLFLDYGPVPDAHPLFTFMCDFVVCLVIFLTYMQYGGSDWEIGVFIAFLCSCLASLLYMGGFIQHGWVYPSLLELTNACALLWITWTGLIEMVGRHENSPVHHMRDALLRSRDLS